MADPLRAGSNMTAASLRLYMKDLTEMKEYLRFGHETASTHPDLAPWVHYFRYGRQTQSMTLEAYTHGLARIGRIYFRQVLQFRGPLLQKPPFVVEEPGEEKKEVEQAERAGTQLDYESARRGIEKEIERVELVLLEEKMRLETHLRVARAEIIAKAFGVATSMYVEEEPVSFFPVNLQPELGRPPPITNRYPPFVPAPAPGMGMGMGMGMGSSVPPMAADVPPDTHPAPPRTSPPNRYPSFGAASNAPNVHPATPRPTVERYPPFRPGANSGVGDGASYPGDWGADCCDDPRCHLKRRREE